MKIAVCTNFVSPYRRPVFEALAEQAGADVRVLVSTDMEQDRQWSVQHDDREPYQIVRVRGVRRSWTKRTGGAASFDQRLERHYPVGLPLSLRAFRPDVVISGELGPRTIAAQVYGTISRTPVVPWAYPPAAQVNPRGTTALIQRRILHSAPVVIGMGIQARATLQQLGARPGSIVDAPNAADVETIRGRLKSADHLDAVRRIRSQHQGRRIAVVVGRLVPMKGIKQVVDAWRRIDPTTRSKWRLVFVGDGPLRSSLEANTEDDSIVVAGHVEPWQVPDWISAADLHVFGSLGDPWGLVVNEAMQCGTPTLCSTLAGCCDDLIREGENGLLFSPDGDAARMVADLSGALCRDDLPELGAQARRDIHSVTPRGMARRMLTAIQEATTRDRREEARGSA